MPMFDRQCETCERILLDCLEPSTAPAVTCECGGNTVRVWTGAATSVVADSIPGGLYIRNGLCGPNGEPKRYDSHSDIRAEAKRRGYENHVVHVGTKGGDKSKFTSKWV